MPTYSIPGPDGKTYSIDGPEGATRDEIIAKIKERQGLEEPTGPLLSDVVAEKRAEAVTGAKRGIIGGLGFPGDVTKMIGGALGLKDVDRALPTSEEVGKFLSPVMTPPRADEPSAKPIEFLANPMSWMGPGGFITKLMGALGAGVGAEAGSKLDTPGQFPIGETVGAVIGGGFTPKGVGKVITPSKEIPAERQAFADFLAKEGVETRAGQVTGSRTLKRGEEQLGAAPLAGGAVEEQTTKQMGQFTNAALRRVGETGERATPEVIDRAFTRIGAEFDRLESNFLEIDQNFKNEVAKAAQDYRNITEPGKRNELIGLLNDQIQRWPTSLAMQGDLYKTLRSSIDRYRRATTSPEFKDALSGIRDALDNAMERTLQKVNPADVGKWQEARRQYRNMLVIEKAVSGGQAATAEGFITPAKLASAAEAVGKRYYRRGKDDFSELAHAGKALLTPASSSGTAENIIAHGVPSAIGTAGALALGGDVSKIPAILAATGVPGLAGKALLSQPAQNWLKNQIAIEYLKRQSPATISGIRALLANLGAQNAPQ